MPELTDLPVIPVTETVEIVARDNNNNRKGVVPLATSVPIGTVLLYAGASVPDGYLLCNGQEISRTGDYADLFAIIGVQFGSGDGEHTFNVPDYRGRVPVGTGQGAGLTTRVTGDTFGEEMHTLTEAEMPAHSHIERIYGAGAGSTYGVAATASSYAPNQTGRNNTQGNTTEITGDDNAHNNLQPSLVVPYIIKY